MGRQRVDIQIEPVWDAVKAAWDQSTEAFRKHGLDEDTAYALSMSAQELLENAVKYGKFQPGDRITLRLEFDSSDVTIEVLHRATTDPHQLRKLDDTIQWIRGYQDPFEAYVERMKTVSASPYELGQSGLGLARVAYEGRCILDFYVDSAGILSLSAVFHRAEGAR